MVIADLTLREAFDHPVHVSGNPNPITGTLLHNLRIVDPGQQGIKINPIGAAWADNGTIECSSIELTDAGRLFVRDNCYTGGIDAHAAWGWAVRRNRIAGFWCPTGLSEHAIHFWNASRDTVVEENVIVDCARGVGFGLLAASGDRDYPDDPYPGVGYLGHIDGVIRNNFIAAADPDLFASESGFDAGIALEQARDSRVVHNTVASTAAPFSSIEWRFANTLVADRQQPGHPQSARARRQSAGQSCRKLDLLRRSPGSSPPPWATCTSRAMPSHPSTPAPRSCQRMGRRDIDLEARTPARDVGADEVVAPLFADGFESGNFNAWSAVAP